MSKKSKADRRDAAVMRSNSYTYSNSKAKRKGTKTEAEWIEANSKIL